MKKKVEKVVKKHLSKVAMFFVLLFLVVGVVLGFLGYNMLNGEGNTTIELKGEEVVVVSIGTTYKEEGFTFVIDDVDYSKEVIISGKVNTNEEGVYVITYSLSNDIHNISLTRVVKVVGGVANGN